VKRLLGSFYARLSAIFLLLVLALGAGFGAIAFSAARRLEAEVAQRVNRDYASNMAVELEPLVADGLMPERLGSKIHDMMVLNPLVEIYVLDREGHILAYFLHPAERIARDSVDLLPVREFIATGGQGLILGEDPRSPTRLKPFSAAPLRIGERSGYVYIIVGGLQYDQSLGVAREGYIVRAGAAAFVFALAATLLVGFVLFFVLTRRLRTLSAVVRAFERGRLGERVQVRGADELGNLARSFNQMAATIEADVEKLRLAEQMRKELIANISHDLRSPLASMKAHLETISLRDAALGTDERRRLLEVSLKNAASLERLVADLFELVRLDTRQAEPRREPFQLAELAQDIALKFRPAAQGAGIALNVDLCPDLRPVRGDIGMIERVLVNLIENALRYTPRGGVVGLSLCPAGARVQVAVADTGTGIPPEDLPHVFDRFYRSDKSRERSTGGAGLGLAIAKQIVELHGGALEVESAAGEGARFHFALDTA
jgi:signal transduction histidine kinase